MHKRFYICKQLGLFSPTSWICNDFLSLEFVIIGDEMKSDFSELCEHCLIIISYYWRVGVILGIVGLRLYQ